MGDVLIDYAIQNIWCNPKQDSQFTFKPKRLTGQRAALNYVKVIDRLIDLPERSKKFHVFQVGQISPKTLNVFRDLPDWRYDRWVRFDETILNKHAWISMYNDHGVTLPRFQCYTQFMDERNLIIAIEIDSKIPVDYMGNLYFKVYQNTYFESDRFTGDIKLSYLGSKVAGVDQIIAYQNQFNSFKALSGYCFVYVNGLLKDSLDLVNVQPGDRVEMIYDSSVKRVITFPIGGLPTFNSLMDSTRKYLLHYPFSETDPIDYFDDQDFYIVKPQVNDRFTGNYFYKHVNTTVRMVTHRDYSLNVNHVVYVSEKLRDLVDQGVGLLDNYAIKVFLRHSGYNRSLVYEANRLHELYKLNDVWVRESLMGSGDSIPVWRAEYLEQSTYTKIMGLRANLILKPEVRDALGYHAISQTFGYSPLAKDSNGVVKLPLLYRENTTVYEYDQNGLYLGYVYHVSGVEYIQRHPDAVYFECIKGQASAAPEVYWGRDKVKVIDNCNWRVYKTHDVSGQITNIWTDITDSDEYERIGEELHYRGDGNNVILMLRTDRKFLAYDLNIKPVAGCIRFPLTELQDRGEGLQNFVMPVPAGELEIFVNGRSLIEGIGYKLKFPEVVIFNKEYLNRPANETDQHIHIRFKGLANAVLQPEKMKDIGFIEHGVLSNNHRFDIRDDKVLRITVDGYLKSREDVVFSELHQGVSILNTVNGLPYSIRDVVVPLNQILDEDTYVFRKASIDKDRMIEAYLTKKLPQPPRDALSAIVRMHEIYSPFICKILFDLQSGIIPGTAYMRNLTDMDIFNLCKPYEDWLVFDPIIDENYIDGRYVIIHPHNHYDVIVINLFAYRFLLRVIKLYAKDRVSLSPFVAIEHQS